MGSEYAKTRHNVGNLCLDYILKKNKLKYSFDVIIYSLIKLEIKS